MIAQNIFSSTSQNPYFNNCSQISAGSSSPQPPPRQPPTPQAAQATTRAIVKLTASARNKSVLTLCGINCILPVQELKYTIIALGSIFPGFLGLFHIINITSYNSQCIQMRHRNQKSKKIYEVEVNEVNIHASLGLMKFSEALVTSFAKSKSTIVLLGVIYNNKVIINPDDCLGIIINQCQSIFILGLDYDSSVYFLRNCGNSQQVFNKVITELSYKAVYQENIIRASDCLNNRNQTIRPLQKGLSSVNLSSSSGGGGGRSDMNEKHSKEEVTNDDKSGEYPRNSYSTAHIKVRRLHSFVGSLTPASPSGGKNTIKNSNSNGAGKYSRWDQDEPGDFSPHLFDHENKKFSDRSRGKKSKGLASGPPPEFHSKVHRRAGRNNQGSQGAGTDFMKKIESISNHIVLVMSSGAHRETPLIR
jgi:hypothetical protein